MSPPDNNLPFQLTSLVGRQREISEVEGLLAEARLLTLTGPGGSGKTRLALAVAAEVVEDYEEGSSGELAPLSDPELGGAGRRLGTFGARGADMPASQDARGLPRAEERASGDETTASISASLR